MFRSKEKKNYPEQKEQIKFFNHIRKVHKQYEDVCFSINNEGKRTGIQLFILIQAGLVPGIPDTFCGIPTKLSPGLFIEFKYGSNTLSPSQSKIIPSLQKMGYQCNVCYSAIEAIEVFEVYISNI